MQNCEQSEETQVGCDDGWIEVEAISISPVRKEREGDRYHITAEYITCETADDAFYISAGTVKEEVSTPMVDRVIGYGYKVGDGVVQACSTACGAGRLAGYAIAKTFSVADWILSTPTE